jgi:hypothetical protein
MFVVFINYKIIIILYSILIFSPIFFHVWWIVVSKFLVAAHNNSPWWQADRALKVAGWPCARSARPGRAICHARLPAASNHYKKRKKVIQHLVFTFASFRAHLLKWRISVHLKYRRITDSWNIFIHSMNREFPSWEILLTVPVSTIIKTSRCPYRAFGRL